MKYESLQNEQKKINYSKKYHVYRIYNHTSKVWIRYRDFSRFRVLISSITHLSSHQSIMLRASLVKINDNRSRNHELSSWQRELIERVTAVGASIIEMKKALNFIKVTVQIILRKVAKRSNDVFKSRFGRSEILFDRDRRYFIRYARLNSRWIYVKLKVEAEIDCSKITLYRTLKSYDLTNWLIKKRSLLTSEIAKKKLNWCLLRVEWIFEQWSKVIWFDECSIEKRSDKQSVWEFRFSDEKWKKEMIQSVFKEKKINVMIWTTFWENDKSDLYKLTRNFVSKKMKYSINFYFEILNDNLLEIWESNLIFMQNNASIYKTKKMMKWFKENNIVITNWSFYSSDLNFIEHVWYELKKLIYEVNSNIDSMTDSDDKIREILWKTLKEIWTLIDVNMMKKLIESMNRRIKAVINANEWYTKY